MSSRSLPNYLIYKIFFPKDLIKNSLKVVCLLIVEMYINRAIISQELSKKNKSTPYKFNKL